MPDIEIHRPTAFCEAFLENYLAGGLGRMQKRDIDILILHLLIKDGRYKFPRDIFKAARELSLTETRLLNLYQEVQLRYQQLLEQDAKAELVKLVRSKAFEIKGNRLVFVVRDPMLGQWFQEWVASVDGFTDSSFNPNLVSIHQKVFLAVLDKIAVNELPEFEGELKQFNEAGGRKGTLRLFVEEFVKAAGNETGKLSVGALATILGGLLGVVT